MDRKISAVLFCQQEHIDVPVEDAWILKDIDAGECYVDKVLRRLQDFGLFKNIYLLVGSEDCYAGYRRFSRENVKVVHMNRYDYVSETRINERNWNFPVQGNGSDTVYLWLYQLQLAFDEDLLFFDSILRVFPSYEQLKMGAELCLSGGKSSVSFCDPLCLSCCFVDRRIMELSFPDGPVTGLPQHTFISAWKMREAFAFIDDKLQEVELSTATVMPVHNDVGLKRKQGFDFFRQFYASSKLKDEKDFPKTFRNYLKIHQSEYDENFFVLRVRVAEDTGGELDIETVEKTLDRAQAVGRITVILENLMRHSLYNELLELLRTKNLHYILETDGQYESAENNRLAEIFDIVKFLNVDEITEEGLQEKHPELDAGKLLKNLFIMMEISHRAKKPQIGVMCLLGEDDFRNLEIISYWKSRATQLGGVLASLGSPKQVYYPQVQFLDYRSVKVPDRMPDFSKPEILISVNSVWAE